MNPAATQDFQQHLDEFRQEQLKRVVAFLAVAAWLLGVVFLFVHFSGAALIMLCLCEGLCWLTYHLANHRRQRLARHLFVGGLMALTLMLAWLGKNPALLFVPVLAGPLAVALLAPRTAVAYTGALVVGQVLLGSQLYPQFMTSSLLLLAPLLVILATGLALIGNANVLTILGWAETSITLASERLEEVREHRGQLHRSVKALDEAVQRLERANEMLTAAHAEAEEARQARNQFALTVSHELRSPLNFIIGFSELMVNAPDTYGDPVTWPTGLYDDIEAIYRSSNHLLHLVNDILDLGRADAQRLILLKERVAPAQIVEDTVGIIGPGVEARKLWLRTEIEPDLPDLFVDRTRIRQVLINLLNNSLRFTEQGGMTIAVRRCEEGVLFSVQDTGSGIPPEGVAKVFEEFGQVNASVWRRRDGSGLGIPISQRFVNMHGGRLWLTSEVGSGTTFSFNLPLPGMEEELPAADGRSDEQMWQANVRRSAPRLVVLLARDPSVGEVLASYLEGYRLIATTAASTALQQVARLLPQALLLDAALAEEPETDRLLQALPYDLPVLVLTLPGQSTHVDALPPGVADYLVKPVLRDALFSALDRLGHPIHRLLLVDDDPDMARYISLALAVRGAPAPRTELLAASCGSDALALLDSLERRNEELPDAVLLDLGLPDMSGWAVLAALQATPAFRDLPVILITAASLPEELDSRQRRTLQVSTRRPLTADELSATLSGILAAIRPRVPAGADASMPTEDFFE